MSLYTGQLVSHALSPVDARTLSSQLRATVEEGSVKVGKAILLQFGQPILLLKLAVPLLLSLAAIRLTVYILRKTFRATPAVKAWEHCWEISSICFTVEK